MPTATLASMIADVLAAVAGVSMEAVDQREKETISMRRPPHRCAAQPPGICMQRVKTHVPIDLTMSDWMH